MSDIVRIGDATLYHGDCLEILPTLDKVDAVVTDPPYGIDVETNNKWREAIDGTHRNKYSKVKNDDKPFDPSPLLAIGGKHLFWGANHYANYLPHSKGWIIWNKRDAGSSGMHSDAELAWTNAIGKTRCWNQFWQGNFRPMERQHGFVHPTQKPVKLMEFCIGLVEGLVFDPFMGSGTTGVACANLGRKFIGIEIERKYFDIACERIDAAYAQGRLFA